MPSRRLSMRAFNSESHVGSQMRVKNGYNLSLVPVMTVTSLEKGSF